MNLYIFDEGSFGGYCVLAKDAEEAAGIIIKSEDFKVEDVEGYKKDILKRIKRFPVAYGQVYRFRGEES